MFLCDYLGQTNSWPARCTSDGCRMLRWLFLVQVASHSPTLDPAKQLQTSNFFLHVRNHPLAYLTEKCKKKKYDELEISNVDSSVHNTSFQSSVVHWWCFMRQPSLFFLFWHVSNGFLAAIRPVKPEVYSLKLNWDVLGATYIASCWLSETCLVILSWTGVCTSPPDFPLVSEWLLIVKETTHWHFNFLSREDRHFMKFYNGLFLFYC